MAINLIAINPFVIHCSEPYALIRQHGNLYINLIESGHDVIHVTDCGPHPTASLSPVPPLLSRMTPGASGMASKVSGFQNVEYTDHDGIKNAFFKNKDIETSLLQKKPNKQKQSTTTSLIWHSWNSSNDVWIIAFILIDYYLLPNHAQELTKTITRGKMSRGK